MLLGRGIDLALPRQRLILPPSWTISSSVDYELLFTENKSWRRGSVEGTAVGELSTTRASNAYAQNAAGVYSSFSSNVPRITDLGLLVEGSRTNSIRNNSMQGASAPSTFPTNWTATGATGLAWTVVGTGTENGVDYIDVNLTGVAVGAATPSLMFDSTIAASVGQEWSISIFRKLIGSATNVTAVNMVIFEYSSAPAYLSQQNIGLGLPGATLSRSGATRTLAQATVATARPGVYVNVPGAGATDITVRIGWPQFELGASVTSPIRTTSAAATRAADYIIVNNFATWFNQTAGTIYAEANVPAVTDTQTLVSADDGGSNERYTTRAASANLNGIIVDGGSVVASMASGTLAANTTAKTALAYAANDAAYTTNGASPTTDTSVTLPTPDRLEIGGRAAGSADFLNGFVRRIAYFPRRLSGAQIQAITS